MKRSILAGSVAACVCGFGAPSFAAEPSEKSPHVTKPAEKCLRDLRALESSMEKDGYWVSGSGLGYGFPMGEAGYGYGYPTSAGPPPATAIGYLHARPGYEVRVLLASANILARQGQQKACEHVLATTRGIYKLYAAEMRSGRVPMTDLPRWRQGQIAAAEPVAGRNISFRSDELLGTDVRNSESDALGSVDDIVMSPKTGKIAFLVIARGGFFGIDEKYVPVPWEDFKVTPNGSLLVLDAAKSAMDAAPQVSHDEFATPGKFDQESQEVDAYWKARFSRKGGN